MKITDDRKIYLAKLKKEKIIVSCLRFAIIFIFLVIWESFARLNLINTFLFSSPSKILNTFIDLCNSGNFFQHIGITLYELFISITLGSLLGLVIAVLLWWNKIFAKTLDPYLTILNSLPKVALGPLIIIWVGASINSIIFMALLISIFITIINIYNSFSNTDKNYILLMRSFGATKWQIFWKVVLPSNYKNIINTLKINISMNLIGVIMGELLVSKKGIGYLIMYGSQVFNIDLVIMGVVILGFISYILYLIIDKFK